MLYVTTLLPVHPFFFGPHPTSPYPESSPESGGGAADGPPEKKAWAELGTAQPQLVPTFSIFNPPFCACSVPAKGNGFSAADC